MEPQDQQLAVSWLETIGKTDWDTFSGMTVAIYTRE
jgi:hypothetical protein